MSVEKARYNGTSWVVYQKGAAQANSGSTVTARFKTTITGTTVAFDATDSKSTGSEIANLTWDYGDGQGDIGYTTVHQYNSAATFNVTLTVTDLQGARGTAVSTITLKNAVNALPVIKMATPIVNGLSVTFSVQGSNDPDGLIVLTEWDFGDGFKATGPTVTHIYAASGPWIVTAKCTDNSGGYSTATVTASPSAPNPGGGGTTTTLRNPWTTGSYQEGMSGNAPVYKARSLAGGASTLELQTLINNMPGNGYIDISNEQVYLSSFSNSAYPQAASGNKFYGLIGGFSNGSFNNQVTLRANAMTAAQASTIQASQTGTSQAAIIRTAASGSNLFALPVYMLGVHFVGADQPRISDGGSAQFPSTPARMKGIDLDLSPTGSLFQNCLMEGFGASNGSTPPWEVGSVDFRRTNGMIMRRVEVSGQLPVGSPSRPNASSIDPYNRSWQRTGGIQWNADKNPIMSNVSLHDTLVSGLTLSIAGTSNNGTNNTQNPKFNNVYVSNNSQRGFSGINLENVIGPLEFNNCTFAMNGTGGYHISYVNGSQFGTIVGNGQLTVREPTWSGLGYNGMFAIRVFRWGITQTTAPTVIKNGKTLTPVTNDSGNPANNYRLIPQT